MQSASDSSSSQSSLQSEHKSSHRHTRNLDEKQQFALEELKAALNGEELLDKARMTDAWLLRFLRARKWNVELAKQMLLNAERWRNDFGTDEVVKEFTFDEKHEVTKYYPQYYHKTDKEGRPIYIERLGNLNMSELRKITTEERMLKYYVLETERFHSVRLPACSLQYNRPVETICTILDLRDVRLRIFWDIKSYVQQTSMIGQDYYPESLGRLYMINAPWMFTTIWTVIKAWLDPVTVKKIMIVNGDGRKELLEQIPAENLPKDLGGTCQCPEGCGLSDAGPWKE